MKVILKLLFGLGSSEKYDPSPSQLYITAIGLLSAFFGSLFLMGFKRYYVDWGDGSVTTFSGLWYNLKTIEEFVYDNVDTK